MPPAIASGMCGQRSTGLFSDGMTEKKGHGNRISGDDELMVDCVIVSFFSIWFVLSGSFYLFVILLSLVSTA
jgi:hypothetical protein